MVAKAKTNETVNIEKLTRSLLEVWIRGTTPLIMERMSSKVKQLLATGSGGKRTNLSQLKHAPVEEYRDSAHVLDVPEATLLCYPASGFKKAMCTGALETAGMTKAQSGRLLQVLGEDVAIYGVPFLRADVVRQSGPARTPDIRFRACLKEWAAKLVIQMTSDTINSTGVCNLLANAGMVCGIGGYRVEKGASSYGQWEVVEPDAVKDIVRKGGKAAQVKAIENPKFYNKDTADLIELFEAEKARRGR